MYVTKRNGLTERFAPDKTKKRISQFIAPAGARIFDVDKIMSALMKRLPPIIATSELDELLAETIAQFSGEHPAYSHLAGRLALDNLYKHTPNSFSEASNVLGTEPGSPLSDEYIFQISHLKSFLDSIIVSSRDLQYSYFGIRALENMYLLRRDGRIIERPQYMFLRVAVTLHAPQVHRIIESYEMMSRHLLMHASPTLFHAGTRIGQLNSSFLVSMDPANSSDIIHRTLMHCAKIGASAGSIGVNVNTCPSASSGTRSQASVGLKPVLKLFDCSMAINQHEDIKRPGAMTMYLEPWHADVFVFLETLTATGTETFNSRMFYALWIPDIFMRRVDEDQIWSLFSPDHVPLLNGTYGYTFDHLYSTYETNDAIPRITISAKSLWGTILQTQLKTGSPFILYKDAINQKTNQKNVGVITHSNLCTEIAQYSSDKETAVCSMASIILPTFVTNGVFSFKHLHHVVKIAVRGLNRVLDVGQCPTSPSAISSRLHRAIGIGIQGLADLFIILRIQFDSPHARELNIRITQTMYHAALEASNEIARTRGYYSSFPGSPASEGLLQFDLWKIPQDNRFFDWQTLRAQIQTHGLANSLLIAMMPTAGTTQFTGCSESFEPILSNVYLRRTPSGDHQLLSSRLVDDLTSLNLWSPSTRLQIIEAKGSIQSINEIPRHIRDIYKTAWEISPRALVDMAADRAPYVCQSQSMAIYMENPTPERLSSLHFYGWRRGLKTGLYFLRMRALVQPTSILTPTHSDSTTHHSCDEEPQFDDRSTTESSICND